MAEPKEIVRAFLEALWASDREGAKARLARDAQWYFLPSLGYERPMLAHRATDIVLDDMIGAFAEGSSLDIELHFLLGDERNVAAEYTARSTAADGSPYENRYCLCAVVEGDRIAEIRPYTDTGPLRDLIEGAGE